MDFIFESLQAQLAQVLKYMDSDNEVQRRKAARAFQAAHRQTKELLNGARQNTGQPDSDLQAVPTDSDQAGKSGAI